MRTVSLRAVRILSNGHHPCSYYVIFTGYLATVNLAELEANIITFCNQVQNNAGNLCSDCDMLSRVSQRQLLTTAPRPLSSITGVILTLSRLITLRSFSRTPSPSHCTSTHPRQTYPEFTLQSPLKAPQIASLPFSIYQPSQAKPRSSQDAQHTRRDYSEAVGRLQQSS